MSYTSVNKNDTVDEALSTGFIRTNKELVSADLQVKTRQVGENSVETAIYITDEVAKLSNLRKGQRISLLRGTGKDRGRFRIVANPNGSLKIGVPSEDSPYRLKIRSARLFDQVRADSTAKVTSYARGGFTISV